jgi:hypothetical protein
LTNQGGTVPAQPGTISGPTSVCRNQTGVVFSIPAVSGATSYSWTLPSGATGTSTTTSITLAFGSTFSGGTLSVRAVNSCGQGTPRTLSLGKTTAVPATPGTITGSTTVCGVQTITYSIAPIANASSYTWSVFGISSSNIVSGQGTRTITVSFSSGFVAAYIGVRAINCAGASPVRTTFAIGFLSTIPVFVGTTNPSGGICGGGSRTYEIQRIANATSYRWSAPSGTTITTSTGQSGNPLTVDSSIRRVTVIYPGNFVSGNVSVFASNPCGNSSTASIGITAAPVPPAAISGPINGVCRKTGIVYSVSPVQGATSYVWSVPAGVSIVGSTTGSSITVNFGNSFSGSGNISVRSRNNCGNSNATSLAITSRLAQPSSISGSTSVCKSNGSVTYTIPSVPEATSYTWTASNGASFVGASNLTSVKVNFKTSNKSSVLLTVTANNACGASVSRTLTVSVNTACRTIEGEESQDQEISQVPNEAIAFRLYPNPARSQLFFDFSVQKQGIHHFKMFDMMGKLVLWETTELEIGNHSRSISFSGLGKGIYFFRLEDEKGILKQQKILIEP